MTNRVANSDQPRGSVIGRNMLWVVVQVVMSTLVLFGVYYVLVRAVGIGQIGLLAVVSTITVVARLSELGLSGTVTRFVPEYLARGERDLAAEVIVTAVLTLGLVVGIGAVLALPALVAILPLIVDEQLIGSARTLLLPTLLGLWTSIVSGCLLMSLDGVHRADRRAQITVASQCVFAIVAVVLIRPFGIAAIPVAQTAQSVFVFLLAAFILRRELPELASARPKIASFKRMWRFGAQLQLITLLILAYDPLTKLLLNHYGALGAVGYFDLANRLISQVRSVIVSANLVMVPHYAKLGAADLGKTASTVRMNSQALLIVASVFFSLLSVSVFTISKIWIGHVNVEFVKIFMILIVGNFASTLNAGIYFRNLGVGALRYNFVHWLWLIAVTAVCGIIGGNIFNVTGVVASISIGMVVGTVVISIGYRKSTVALPKSNMFGLSMRFGIVGGLVFGTVVAAALIGYSEGAGLTETLAPIVFGVAVWLMYICAEARIARQSPWVWTSAVFVKLRSS